MKQQGSDYMKNAKGWILDTFLRKGVRHDANGEPCQDSLNYYFDDNCIIAALSDGISSTSASEKASEAAVNAVIAVLADSKGEAESFLGCKKEDEAECGNRIKYSIVEEFRRRKAPFREADCTLTFVYISLKQQRAFVGYIGDSCVCIFNQNAGKVFTQTADYGGGTESLDAPQSEHNMELKRVKLDAVCGFMLCSDGVADKLYTKGEKAIIFKAAESFANSVFSSDGHEKTERYLDRMAPGDDVSIVLIMRQPISLEDDPTWLCSCGCRNPIYRLNCYNCRTKLTRLYAGVVNKYDGVYDMLRYLNAHPDEEIRVLKTKNNAINASVNAPLVNTANPMAKRHAEYIGREINHHADTRKESMPLQNQSAQGNRESPKAVETRSRGVQSADSSHQTQRETPRPYHPNPDSRSLYSNTQRSDDVTRAKTGNKEERKKSGSGFVAGLAAILALGACVLGVYAFFQQKSVSAQMDEMNQKLITAESRIAELEAKSIQSSATVSAAYGDTDNAFSQKRQSAGEIESSVASTQSQVSETTVDNTEVSSALYNEIGDVTAMSYLGDDDRVTSVLDSAVYNGMSWKKIITSSGKEGWIID